MPAGFLKDLSMQRADRAFPHVDTTAGQLKVKPVLGICLRGDKDLVPKPEPGITPGRAV